MNIPAQKPWHTKTKSAIERLSGTSKENEACKEEGCNVYCAGAEWKGQWVRERTNAEDCLSKKQVWEAVSFLQFLEEGKNQILKKWDLCTYHQVDLKMRQKDQKMPFQTRQKIKKFVLNFNCFTDSPLRYENSCAKPHSLGCGCRWAKRWNWWNVGAVGLTVTAPVIGIVLSFLLVRTK